VRRAAVILVAAIALAAAPAAGAAWTTLAGGVVNIVAPSMIVTSAGTELVSFETPNADTISVSRNGAAARVVVSGDPIAGQTQLVQQPNGAIQLYFPNAGGVGRLTSTDDGVSWTGPIQTQSHDVAGVTGAAVAPDGTPYFVQWHTDAVNVFRGLNGETSRNVYTPCCGYDVSVAVDTTGLAQVAFYSNASSSGAFIYEPLAADLTPGTQVPLGPTVEHSPSAPLVADRNGDTFMAWAPGNPTATAFTVVTFHNGQPAGDGVTFRGTFGGGDPHMALSVDSSDRLWAVWTGGGAVHVARSRSHGAHFGAVVSTAVPGTMYQVSAVGLPGDPGKVDVVINTGSTLIEQQLEPGLSVRVFRTTHKVGKKLVVTRWVQALDDGFGVPGATFTIRGRTFHADASGKAKVVAGSGKASAPGYVGASLKVP
jgi:hypothetical protein